MISKASVADELAFSALPIETQEMVKRLYGTLKKRIYRSGYDYSIRARLGRWYSVYS